jgi:hypothetical protein
VSGMLNENGKLLCHLLIDVGRGRHVYNILAEIVTLLIYLVSMFLLPEYFGTSPPGKKNRMTAGE